jgi:glycosyltransferase involved in cell wall biosynthesis
MAQRLNVAVYHSLHSGGAKRTLYEEVWRLTERHHLDLYTLSSADNDFCDVRPYVKESHVYRFEPLPLFRSPFGRLNQLVRLIDLIRLQKAEKRIAADIDREGYDIVFVHPSYYTQSPLVLKFLATPSVYYCHEPFREFYEVPIVRPYSKRAWARRVLDSVDILNWIHQTTLRRLDDASLNSACRVLVNSYFSRNNIRRIYGVTAEVCYHGVDVGLFRPLAIGKDRMVLSVGALTPAKGFDFVIESLGRIPTEQRPKLFIVSNYQESREQVYLSRLASLEGVQVFFCTMVEDERLVELYNSALVTVYAPIREPFGLVPLESMACGTPVVAVGEGGVCESVVHEQTGLLTNRDPGQFAAAIRTMCENEELAKRYGEQGREYVLEKWSWEKAMQRLEEHLLQVANRRAWRVDYE